MRISPILVVVYGKATCYPYYYQY